MTKIDFTKVEAFSTDGDTFYEDDQCVLDYCEENLSAGEVFTMSIGKKRKFTHGDFFHRCQLENLVEEMQERAHDEVGEVAETYLEHLATPDNEAEFQKLVCEWLQKKVGSVNVWGLIDTQEVKCVWDGENYSQTI